MFGYENNIGSLPDEIRSLFKEVKKINHEIRDGEVILWTYISASAAAIR
ncbi:MAG: hypothetical protein HYT73_01830 [Candidatus Aenigmarchaeota archaeon]|nr:hypothetical protein [Candidatus Aenigmarchaeota archaeon]